MQEKRCLTENMKEKYQKNKSKKKPGRKAIRRKFEETRLGHLLKLEAPTEFDLIVTLGGSSAPSADLIEQLSYASLNPLFRKAKFRKGLIEYRKTGLYCGKPRQITPQIESYYIKLRKNQLK